MSKKKQKQEIITVEATQVAPVEKDFANSMGYSDISSIAIANGFFPADTGTPVGPISAMQVSAVYASIRALADDVGGLPLELHEKLPSGGSRVVQDHPILDLLDEPNPWQTGAELITNLAFDLVLNGNAYVFIERNMNGDPTNLIAVSPFMMQPLVDQSGSGELYYRFTITMYPTEMFACGSEDIIHIKSSVTTPNGVFGYSPVELGKQVLGNSIAVQKSANCLFANGSQLRGVLTIKGKLSPQAAKNLRADFDKEYSAAANAGKTAILEEGSTWTPTEQKADEAQLLDSRKFSVEEVARWFRIPPHKIGHMDGENYSTLVEGNQAYIDDSLMPICKKIEKGMLRRLFLNRSDRKRYFLEFNFDELQRGDELARAQAAQIWRFTGLKTQNELRAREHLNPTPDGNTFLSPLNMEVSAKPSQTGGAEQQPLPNADDEDSAEDSED